MIQNKQGAIQLESGVLMYRNRLQNWGKGEIWGISSISFPTWPRFLVVSMFFREEEQNTTAWLWLGIPLELAQLQSCPSCCVPSIHPWSALLIPPQVGCSGRCWDTLDPACEALGSSEMDKAAWRSWVFPLGYSLVFKLGWQMATFPNILVYNWIIHGCKFNGKWV